jgi:hypothetical protein
MAMRYANNKTSNLPKHTARRQHCRHLAQAVGLVGFFPQSQRSSAEAGSSLNALLMLAKFLQRVLNKSSAPISNFESFDQGYQCT